jgi:four helix bundle protein
VFDLSQRFPREETYSLTDQVRRSSRSIGAQIAESWAKRLYPRHFVSKLTDADGEQLETQHWLIEALDCNYLDEREAGRLLGLCGEIGRMLGSMIRKAESFASDEYTFREEPPPYLTNDLCKFEIE